MADSNIDSELLQGSKPQLFLNSDNQPLVFHIPLTEEDRDELSTLIIQHGGVLTEDANAHNVLVLSKYGEVHHDTFDPRLVYDSTLNGKLVHLDNYKNVVQSGETAGDVQQLVSYLHENQDNDDTDKEGGDANGNEVAAGAATVSSNDDTNTGGNVLSEDTSASSTGNADSRVLNAIAEAREAGLTLNPGQKRTFAGEAVPTSKNGFSPEEDEIILEQVRQNPKRRSSHKLFYEIAKIIGRHTGNSIRYRFRNNLQDRLQYVYKTDATGNLLTDANGKYIPVKDLPLTLKRKFSAKEDYELSKAVRAEFISKEGVEYQRNPTDSPLSGRFFEQLAESIPTHSKSAWRDRYRKFALPYGIDNYIEYYENEVANNRTPDEIKNFTGKHLYKSRKNLNNIEDEIGSKLTEHNNQFEEQRKKRKSPGNYSKNHDSQVASENNNTNNDHNNENQPDSTNIFIAGDHDELNELDHSNYYNPHTAVAVAQATKVSPNNTSNNSGALEPEEFLTSDLVTDKFFTFQPLITVVEKVTEIVNRQYDSTDAENLIQALYQEAGIQKKFGTFIITSVCGDLILIPKYIELFLQTGQNPPKDTHGIWTARDDEYLRSGEEGKMGLVKALHGNRRIELRRQFISQELV